MHGVNPRWLLVSGMALVLFGTAVALAVALSDEPAGDTVSTTPVTSKFEGPVMPRNLRAADFTLTDQRGRTVRLADARGRIVVLTFLHSGCTSTCPVTVQTIRGALDDIGHRRREIDAFAVSVDPKEDTPKSVRRFVAVQHAGSFLRYLTGSPSQLAKVWKAYAMKPQGPGGEDHSAYVLLVDRRGVQRVGFPAHGVTPETLAHDLRVLLDE